MILKKATYIGGTQGPWIYQIIAELDPPLYGSGIVIVEYPWINPRKKNIFIAIERNGRGYKRGKWLAEGGIVSHGYIKDW